MQSNLWSLLLLQLNAFFKNNLGQVNSTNANAEPN